MKGAKHMKTYYYPRLLILIVITLGFIYSSSANVYAAYPLELIYTVSDDNEAIIRGIEPQGYNGDVVIPEYLYGHKVTRIADTAYGFELITSVTLPNSITSIGTSFELSWDLTNITIPESVTSISEYAFLCADLSITGYTGSYAQKYALDNGISFTSLGVTPKLEPAALSFDKNIANQADVLTSITWNNASLVNDVIHNNVSIGPDAYTVDSNTLVIKKDYLTAQSKGNLELKVVFDKEMIKTLNIEIQDTTTAENSAALSEYSVIYDVNNPADINVDITWNSALSITNIEIVNSADPLVWPTIDKQFYTVTGSVLTFKKEYICTWSSSAKLNVEFDKGYDAELTIIILDNEPISILETAIGRISLVAFDYAPAGWVECNGMLLPIYPNAELFNLIGTRFGGNGVSTFVVPNLTSPIPGARYCIAVQGTLPTSDSFGMNSFCGQIELFPYTFSANDWVRCEGQTLLASQYSQLYSVIGNKFGGAPGQDFKLPDLRGTTPDENLHYYIALVGYLPGSGSYSDSSHYFENLLGLINMFPKDARFESAAGMASGICDGSALSINNNNALYSLIGTTYGSSSTEFNKPDFRGAEPDPRLSYYLQITGFWPSR